jgi:hypothetical protein
MSYSKHFTSDVVNIYLELFKNTWMHDKVTDWTRMCVHGIFYCDSLNLQTVSVTLTFKEKPWFLNMEHCLDVIYFYTKLFLNASMHDKVTVWTWVCVRINSNCDTVKIQNVSVTLTLQVGTWSLDVTHQFHMVDIYAKLFFFKMMHNKVTVRT